MISPDFPLELTGYFPGKHFIHFLVLKMKDFRNFVLDNCILNFDAAGWHRSGRLVTDSD